MPDFLPTWPPVTNSFTLFGLLLLAGLIGGWIAARTRVLPSITGYIAIGFILGPGVLGLLNEEALRHTRIFADISLGLVVASERASASNERGTYARNAAHSPR